MSKWSTFPPQRSFFSKIFTWQDQSRLYWWKKLKQQTQEESEVHIVQKYKEPKVEKPEIETLVVANGTIGAKPKDKGKSLPKSQRGSQVKHFCHHCGMQGHTRPNCFKLQALKRDDSLHGQDNSRRMPKGIQAKGESEGQLTGDVEKHFTMPS